MAKPRCELAEERRSRILDELHAFYVQDFDEELSAFRAERLLAFFIKNLGPPVYNQAVEDAVKFMQEKLEDMDSDLRELDIAFERRDSPMDD